MRSMAMNRRSSSGSAVEVRSARSRRVVARASPRPGGSSAFRAARRRRTGAMVRSIGTASEEADRPREIYTAVRPGAPGPGLLDRPELEPAKWEDGQRERREGEA